MLRRFVLFFGLFGFASPLCAQHDDHDHHDHHSGHDHHTRAIPYLPLDISANLLVAGGASSERDGVLESLQGGDHDPRRRGFTLQQLELGLLSSSEPFSGQDIRLTAAAFVTFGEEEIHIEEAFARFEELPYDSELEAGVMFAEFGIQNTQHPHAWDWIDQPLVFTRMFGAEGMGGTGARIARHFDFLGDSRVHAAIYDAFGERMVSFGAPFGGHAHQDEDEEEAGVGGRPLIGRDTTSLSDFAYLARWQTHAELSSEIALDCGASALFGPNATGNDGHTFIWGADVRMAFNDSEGAPVADWQSEFVMRRYRADEFSDEGDPLDPLDDVVLESDTLTDWGFYTQIRYWIDNAWAIGVRFDYAGSSGRNYHAADNEFEPAGDDPLRNDRLRISPLATWQPIEPIRVRLQYNYDDAEHLGSIAHSIWLGFEWRFQTGGEHRH